MKHDAPFDIWWGEVREQYASENITEEEFTGYPFGEGLEKACLKTFAGVLLCRFFLTPKIIFYTEINGLARALVRTKSLDFSKLFK